MARTSRVSSGSTSRVPLGMGWIIFSPFNRTGTRGARTPRARGPSGVDWLGRHPLDAGAELAQALVDALVAAIDLANVAALRAAVRAEGRQQHRHAGPDVGRLDSLSAQAAGDGDDRPVGIAHDDVGAHQDQLV